METRVRDPKTAKLTDLPHCLWVQKATHGTGPAGNPSRKTRLSEGDSQKNLRAARAGEKKGGISLEGGRFLDTPQKTVCPPEPTVSRRVASTGGQPPKLYQNSIDLYETYEDKVKSGKWFHGVG
jgi:hypothetical protein